MGHLEYASPECHSLTDVVASDRAGDFLIQQAIDELALALRLEKLGPDGIERLCKGECHNPSDVRRPITRIEIVRIRPQQVPGEPIAKLIDDPFLVLPCAGDAAGCSAEFSDPEFPTLGREALYYARVYEAPDQAINAGGIRCERDENGNCTRAELCPGAGGAADDCLAPREPRAWSSPIYVSWAAPAAGQPTTVAARASE